MCSTIFSTVSAFIMDVTDDLNVTTTKIYLYRKCQFFLETQEDTLFNEDISNVSDEQKAASIRVAY